MGNYNTKFGIKTYKHPKGWWGFGACISHAEKETYLYINFFRWCISIGFLYEEEEEYFIDAIDRVSDNNNVLKIYSKGQNEVLEKKNGIPEIFILFVIFSISSLLYWFIGNTDYFWMCLGIALIDLLLTVMWVINDRK